jgi:mannitol/fructose-specific phosphotransferase system IIA component (Ntr-type)
MPLADCLHPAAVLVAPSAQDKWQLIEQLTGAMVAAGKLPAARQAEAVHALFAREKCVSTGMEHGIAIPHAALEQLPHMIVALALLPDGLEFESQDNHPAQIVVAVLVPRQEKLLHLQTLAEVARRLGNPSFKDKLLRCRDGRAAVALWAQAD